MPFRNRIQAGDVDFNDLTGQINPGQIPNDIITPDMITVDLFSGLFSDLIGQIDNTQIPNAGITHQKIASLIADLFADDGIPSTKISGLIANKILAGAILVALDITSIGGKIRAGATTGARTELNWDGLVIFDADSETVRLNEDGLTALVTTSEALTDAFRFIAAETGLMIGELRGKRTSGEAVALELRSRTLQNPGNLETKWTSSAGVAAARLVLSKDSIILDFSELNPANDTSLGQAGRITVDADKTTIDSDHGGSGAQGFAKFFKGEQADGHRVLLNGLTKLDGAGLLYMNGFKLTGAKIKSGGKRTGQVTLPVAFPTNSPAPVVIGSGFDSTTAATIIHGTTVAGSERTKIKCSLTNNFTKKRALAGVCIAIAVGGGSFALTGT